MHGIPPNIDIYIFWTTARSDKGKIIENISQEIVGESDHEVGENVSI